MFLFSITEENYNFLPQSPSKKDFEGKSGTKVSRTFSYIKNKMSSSKKSKVSTAVGIPGATPRSVLRRLLPQPAYARKLVECWGRVDMNSEMLSEVS